MAPRLSFVTLDVFTETQFAGNPVAIVKVPRDAVLRQDQKQRIALEFNLSETVFLHEQTESQAIEGVVKADIFNPVAEHPFAGHPTVGLSNYLLRHQPPERQTRIVALLLKAGRFDISLNESIGGIQIALAHAVHVHANPSLLKRLGNLPVVSIVKGMTFALANLPSLEELGKQTQNLVGAENTHSSTSLLDEGWQAGMLATYFYVEMGYENGSDGVKQRKLRTRMFSRREDPGTGSAASALVSFLTLQEKHPGRYRYHLIQGIELGRENHIYLEVMVKQNSVGGFMEVDQVVLSGQAVLNMEGTVAIPH
ncbi:phenazine biosynthesis PhzC/PhzF protein [Thozetella sp. PMI_491]|nr:phenazine biosynthesis PhzC/PhzF protein [Thozetella sp. PMI_491]